MILGLALVLSLVVVIIAFKGYVKISGSHKWPVVKGMVTTSKVESGFKSMSGGKHIYISEPVVKYEYFVDSKKFRSSQIKMVQVNTANSDAANQVIEMYPEGGEVDVYYNPSNVSESVLELSSPILGLLPAGFVGLISIVIVFVLYLVTE